MAYGPIGAIEKGLMLFDGPVTGAVSCSND
jgi:hypothetical protein